MPYSHKVRETEKDVERIIEENMEVRIERTIERHFTVRREGTERC
jgi:hypothetical protein